MAIKGPDTSNTQLFTDIAQLNKLKAKSGENSGEALREVAQQFEQMFMNMMLKSMRQANESLSEDSYFNSSETQFFQEMMDQQLSMDLATKGQGIGLADVIVRQLGGESSTRANPIDPASLLLNPSSTMSNQEAPGLSVEQTNALQLRRSLVSAYDEAANLAATAVLSKAIQQEGADSNNNDEVNAVVAKLDTAVAAVAKQANNEELTNRFGSPQEFVEKLLPLAERMAPELGVDPRVLLAQSALETGWGKFITADQTNGQSSFNLFNIKTGANWSGESVNVNTLEYKGGVPVQERAQFRAYASYADSFRDYVDFLKNSSRYQQALDQADNPISYLQELQAAGYATDPEYADKIARILSGDVIAALNVGKNQG